MKSLKRSYDYGESPYMKMDKYKSISDYRKKREQRTAAVKVLQKSINKDNDTFTYDKIAQDMWIKEWKRAKEHFNIRFDWENNESSKERKVIVIKNNEDSYKFNCELFIAGGDWENSSYYFRCQLVDGSIYAVEAYEGEEAPMLPFPGAISQYNGSHFILIPPKEAGNTRLIAGKDGWIASQDNDDVPELNSKAAWTWLKKYLENLIEIYLSSRPKEKRVADRRKERVAILERLANCLHKNTITLMVGGVPVLYCEDCKQAIDGNRTNRGDWGKEFFETTVDPYSEIGFMEARPIETYQGAQ